jgi:hypothetical protein
VTAISAPPNNRRRTEAAAARDSLPGVEGVREHCARGYSVFLQACDDGSYLVWFFHMLLGSFVPGRDDTVEPIAGTELRQEPMNIIVRTEPTSVPL